VLDAPVLADPVAAVPEFAVLVLALPWVAPGSATAMAPVASTLATPTPAVTADNRFMPRRRLMAAVT